MFYVQSVGWFPHGSLVYKSKRGLVPQGQRLLIHPCLVRLPDYNLSGNQPKHFLRNGKVDAAKLFQLMLISSILLFHLFRLMEGPFALAYPSSVKEIKENQVVFQSGKNLPYDDHRAKTAQELLDNPDIEAHLHYT